MIVSNRLPVTARWEKGSPAFADASGGLATGLRSWHARTGGLWIGWPGDLGRCSEPQKSEIDRHLAARGIVPLHLSREQVDRYYAGFSNGVIWPLFHYLVDRVPADAAGWEAYREVNEAFADAVVREYQAGDRIWVHDYQLMLVPQLIRQRLPEASIGFFLHIPFPSSEIFRTLPWRKEILAGLLGADVVGFHTYAYMRHFIASLLHVSGMEADVDRVQVDGREVVFSVFPMGVDAQAFDDVARSADVEAAVAAIRADAGDRQIVLGVDRLDYTKGIPRRLVAIEHLLEQTPGLSDRIRYIQVAVPSRGDVSDYQRFKRQIEERVGRINGKFGTLRSTPVHYINRSLSTPELVALYRAADVMLVTPLRDGMNLVAKEFAASRFDERGVLLLSEFAGAAAELDGAVVVNPYDIGEVSAQLARALTLPVAEQGARMRRLRERVFGHDVHAWAAEFVGQLEAIRPSGSAARVSAPPTSLASAIEEARRTSPLRLLLDYDGTLVPLAKTPELAAPDDELRWLLDALAATPDLDVEIVSGRPRESLEKWFANLPIPLWAEHGFWYRRATGQWQPATHIDANWHKRVLPILERFTATTPGSRLELKAASLAWHFRGAQRGFGARQAHELRMLLGDALSNQPLEVLEGHKVVEVRLRGISKGVVAHRPDVAPNQQWRTIAIGDDRTDEDLFRALPSSSIKVAVGQALNGAQYVVPSYRAVRRLLATLLPEGVAPAAVRSPAEIGFTVP